MMYGLMIIFINIVHIVIIIINYGGRAEAIRREKVEQMRKNDGENGKRATMALECSALDSDKFTYFLKSESTQSRCIVSTRVCV